MKQISVRRLAIQTTIIAGLAGLGLAQIAVAQDEEPEEAR